MLQNRHAFLLVVGFACIAGCQNRGDSTRYGSTDSAIDNPATPAAVQARQDMTHLLTSDTPYSTVFGGPMDDGTLPKNTQVLLVVPGSTAEVVTSDGRTVYLKSASLEPLSK